MLLKSGSRSLTRRKFGLVLIRQAKCGKMQAARQKAGRLFPPHQRTGHPPRLQAKLGLTPHKADAVQANAEQANAEQADAA